MTWGTIKLMIFIIEQGKWFKVMLWLEVWMITWKGSKSFESWDLRSEPLVHCRIFWQRAAKEEVLGG